jgi:hypothetical protein
LLLGALGTAGAFALTGTIAAGCAPQFDTTRSPPPRGTIGQELFSVLCDRVGAQALPEDLTGASFHSICHPDPTTGAYTSSVDSTALPPITAAAVDADGNPVSVATQTTNRTYAINRIQALATDRPNLIASLDATFPAISVPVKDLSNPDPTQTCQAATADGGVDTMSNQLADLLARFQPLYNDGTIPQTTESLARVFNAIKSSPDAQTSFARFEARQGYRPIDVALGAARPVIAYGGLRDLSNSALALLSADSQPYNTSKVDSSGNRIPIPGPANPQFAQLIATAHDELLYSTPDPVPVTLASTTDPAIGRTVLNRPWTDLEVLEHLFYDSNSVYGSGGGPNYIVLRDSRGYAQVALVNGVIPPPFTDADNDGLADVDALGDFITTDGQPAPSPFFAVGATYGTRDNCGRAIRSGTAASDDAGVPLAGDAGTPLDAALSPDAATSTPVTDDSGAPATASCGYVPPGALLYNYLDTSSVFATSLLHNLKPLANPDETQNHNTLMYALAGSEVLFGQRDGTASSSKCYAPDPTNPSSCSDPTSLLKYNSFETDTSALLDLVYALGQVLGDPTMDDTLAYVQKLFTSDLGDMARLAGDALAMKAKANQHTEAKIPAASTFWDEMLDVTVQIEQQPGLLEDVLTALGQDGSQNLGQIFASYMQFNDRISYDGSSVAALNSPPINLTAPSAPGGIMQTPVDRSQPDTGFNRSAFFRFLSLIHDTDGVTACNKAGATVLANLDGINLSVCSGGLCGLNPPFQQCTVFKIENLAKFYLDSIVGKAELNFRSDFLKSGLVGIGAATVSLVESSSDIGLNANDTYGFWETDTSAKKFHPRPQWLNRLVFFDQTTNTQSGDPLYTTQQFLSNLNGPHIASSVCTPLPPMTDPCLTSSDCKDTTDIDPGGKIPGLFDCTNQPNDWLDVRGKDTIFVWEQFGFYNAITPLLNAFISHGREDLFIGLMETLYRHWGDAQGTADECTLSVDPTQKYKQCTKDGLVTYEPLLAADFQGDIIPALHDLEPSLVSNTIPHCTATDPKTNLCTAEQTYTGINVLANAARALVDPAQASAIGLVDRHGNATGLRNDGSTNPQVTPIYLLTEALNNMDAAFANLQNPVPTDDRLAQWRLARSQLVDQFLTIDGSGTSSTFDNVAIPKFVPTLIDVARSQLFAHCPTTFAAPFTRCAWARDTLTTELANVVHGPTFAATMDVLDAMRLDSNTRAQTGNLLQYLLDAASQNDALPNLLATTNDIIQVMKDDTNLVPLYNALATAFVATQYDAQGDITQKSVIDASLALLGRASGRAYDTKGDEICSAELDPNQILTIALANVVTPMANASGTGTGGQLNQSPLQTIMDVIGDVNRADPSQTGKLAADDYANIANEVSDFMLNPINGLEQFYEIVRLGTVAQ